MMLRKNLMILALLGSGGLFMTGNVPARDSGNQPTEKSNQSNTVSATAATVIVKGSGSTRVIVNGVEYNSDTRHNHKGDNGQNQVRIETDNQSSGEVSASANVSGDGVKVMVNNQEVVIETGENSKGGEAFFSNDSSSDFFDNDPFFED